jgi:hypothetical protein
MLRNILRGSLIRIFGKTLVNQRNPYGSPPPHSHQLKAQSEHRVVHNFVVSDTGASYHGEASTGTSRREARRARVE